MESGKVWWKSKTVLMNMVAGVCLAMSAAIPSLKGIYDWVQSNAVLIGTIWSGVNLLLRFVTKDKIVLSD